MFASCFLCSPDSRGRASGCVCLHYGTAGFSVGAARYSLYHINAVNSRNVGGLNAVSRGSGLDDTDQTIAVSDVATLGRKVNEARFQFTRSRLDAPVNDSVGPAVAISGVANFGTATSSPLARDINLFEAVENVSVQHGLHSPKAGVDFLYNSDDR